MHAHTPHHKWWDLNINSMKYSCVSASRSSRTTTEGDLPSDLRILLHSSLSLFLQLSLSLLCCGIPSHCHGVVYQRVPRYCSSSLWYRLNTCKVLLCMCLGVGVGGQEWHPLTRPSSLFTQHAGKAGRAGESDCLRISKRGEERILSTRLDALSRFQCFVPWDLRFMKMFILYYYYNYFTTCINNNNNNITGANRLLTALSVKSAF